MLLSGKAASRHFFIAWRIYAFTMVLATNFSPNITINDGDGSIIYSPGDNWDSTSRCIQCLNGSDAETAVDTSKILDGKFNAAFYNGSGPPQTATFAFNAHSSGRLGSALYVYGVLYTGLNASYHFSLDGQPAGTFVRSGNSSNEFLYNQTLYSNSSLSEGTHKFMLQNGWAGNGNSLVLLDSFVYTRVSQNVRCCLLCVAGIVAVISSDHLAVTMTPSMTIALWSYTDGDRDGIVLARPNLPRGRADHRALQSGVYSTLE
ncbi:hypothetical protein PHLGIDRAFT_493838 [Phlebiopsis gigantea 11061_1 CR5-6]|uniref:Uncharacterized protein n=1 Tax=Phlebiopsis gigantea (strain 11061_1 CR5-6) TaxID=745531 RepID=A0A0C3PFG7_PHLG1|nr:hypothetical protein PHLGIDRAFT_493838 [Phlebiopsis gigantea 11061_1 CR5-6]